MDLDDDELRATRRMNGADKRYININKKSKDINNLIEELTKVRSDELSKDGLKLFNKINEIIDKNKELEEENRIFALEGSRVRLKMYIAQNYIPVSLVEEKIEELNRKIKYEDNEKVIIWLHKQRKILQELLEKRK